jgi:GTPase SAR1 family protein
VAVIVFDCTVVETFNDVPGWLKFLKDHASIPHIILVGNKSDLPAKVDLSEAGQFAAKQKMVFVQTSAITREVIDLLLAHIVEFTDGAKPTLAPDVTTVQREASPAIGGWFC